MSDSIDNSKQPFLLLDLGEKGVRIRTPSRYIEIEQDPN